MDRLTEHEIGQYRDKGYILYKKPVLPDATFSELERRFDEYYEEHRSDSVWDCMHWHDDWFLELLYDKDILDNLVEPLIGPDIAIWASSFLYKPPRSEKATPWHEDSSYFSGRLDNFENMVTIWLAIDPATPQNGCMRIIPESHHDGFSKYKSVDRDRNLFDLEIEEVDESKAVDFVLNKNECSLHDSRIIHGGNRNRSSTRRCGYQMRYYPSSVKFNPDHEMNTGFKIYLARGRDLAGNPFSS